MRYNKLSFKCNNAINRGNKVEMRIIKETSKQPHAVAPYYYIISYDISCYVSNRKFKWLLCESTLKAIPIKTMHSGHEYLTLIIPSQSIDYSIIVAMSS